MNKKYLKVELTKISKILVPFDGSKQSISALYEAISLAKFSNGSITGIYIIPSNKGTVSFVDAFKPLSTLEEKNYTTKQLVKANRIMGNAKKICKEYFVDFNGVVAKGVPRYKILQYSKEKEFDHIVISMTGKKHAGEMLLGSISYHVIHNSDMPVTVVR